MYCYILFIHEAKLQTDRAVSVVTGLSDDAICEHHKGLNLFAKQCVLAVTF